MKILFLALFSGAALMAAQKALAAEPSESARLKIFSASTGKFESVAPIDLPEELWRERLSPEAFEVTRKNGTERAFTGKYWDNHEEGLYKCAGCGTDLFSSSAKYESFTGWPSFYEPVARENLSEHVDKGFFMTRTEVRCARCGAHLGHVFGDGPPPTGLRYCMNSAALDFTAAKVK